MQLHLHQQLDAAAPQAPAQSGRAGQARHDDQALIAGYESAVREPGAWHHIGQHMRADAAPVRLHRPTPVRLRQQRNRLVRIRVVIAVALVSAAVLVLQGIARGGQS